MNKSPCLLGGSQTRVCDTGPQFTPFSLFRRGPQRYSAIRTDWRESDARDPTATSAPAALGSPSCRAATRKPNASSCWLPAWRFLTSIRTSASLEPLVPTAGGAGTLWTPDWLKATPWMRSRKLRRSSYWVLLFWGQFCVSKTIIPDSEEHFLSPSARRDTHLFGGSEFRFVIQVYPVRMVAFTIKPDCAIQ